MQTNENAYSSTSINITRMKNFRISIIFLQVFFYSGSPSRTQYCTKLIFNQKFDILVWCDCTLSNPGDFNCFDEYGDPVSGSTIPSWGLCEKKTCPESKYPDPTDVYCDGDRNDWSSSPNDIKCIGLNSYN